MKFVCMICDSQMKVVADERQRGEGTMSIVLECPDCFGRIGMLTNPMETKLLDSLDVSVCPVGGKGRASEHAAKSSAPTAPASSAAQAPGDQAAKCPVPHLHDKVAELKASASASPAIPWSADAVKRLDNVPSFAREMARLAIEGFARQQGAAEITPDVMNDARVRLGF